MNDYNKKLSRKEKVNICLLVVSFIASIFCTIVLISASIDAVNIIKQQSLNSNMFVIRFHKMFFYGTIIFWIIAITFVIEPSLGKFKSNIKIIRIIGRIIFGYILSGIIVTILIGIILF